jgi:hypothetical protein
MTDNVLCVLCTPAIETTEHLTVRDEGNVYRVSHGVESGPLLD